MKKGMFATAGILFLAGLFVASYASGSGDVSFQNRSKIEAQDSTKNAKYSMTKRMLEGHDFVLEADYLSNSTGNRIPVTSSLNFISVDSSHAVIQIGRTTGIGYNGVGGVTAEGTISRYDLNNDNKHSSFYLSFSVTTVLGHYDVNMTVNGDGYANATLSGIRGGQLIYSGYLVPIENSSVYKGYNTY